MSTAKPMYDWKSLPWKQIEGAVFKLQKRIYRATQQGDTREIHRLQRLLTNSWSGRCLAVRKVTQDNQGKNTAGVDGKKRLRPTERLQLVNSLKTYTKPQPVRRVWIPKPGKDERRPLGIPTIEDRAHQALVKLALEPEWEARFEPNSYGFRPGRSCHDAIEAIFTAIKHKPRYVLDADIKGCFDNISHDALLDKVNTYPKQRRIIKQWLKAGVMENLELTPTGQGTPQGGVISPLLANIALHGLETEIKSKFPKWHKGKSVGPHVVRYADDFVILHHELPVIEQCKVIVTDWLKTVGLELKDSKTRITHTAEMPDGDAGFDFLGFHIRQHKVGKTNVRRIGRKEQGVNPFKTIIKPSKEATKRYYRKVSDAVVRHGQQKQAYLIRHLNPVITGWCNYYSTVVSTNTFNKLDHLLVRRLLRWGYRRHPKWGSRKVVEKYFNPNRDKGNMRPWDFIAPEGSILKRHADHNIVRHVLINTAKSPYDGDYVYWVKRMGRHPQTPTRVANLLKKQKGRCFWCNLFFRTGDLMEVDHIVPREIGGRDAYYNWQLLHRHCHDLKTASDASVVDNNHISEEPDEVETLTSGFEDQHLGRPEC